MKNAIWIGIFVLFSLTVGCSHNVPLRHSLELSNPPNPKLVKKVVLVMPGDQANLVIRHKPDPLADTYVFAGGTALKDTLMSVLGQLFQEATFADALNEGQSPYDMAIEVNLNNYEIILNIYTGNVVNLGIDYTVYNQEGSKIKLISTNASSKDRYSGGDLAATFLAGAFYNIGKMKASSGAAWDQATTNSIAELVDNLMIIAKAQ